MALKDTWVDLVNGESEVNAEGINDIARAVIETEKAGYAKTADVQGFFDVAHGTRYNEGRVEVVKATNEQIDVRSNSYRPIVPANLEYAVKSVGDGYYATEEQIGDVSTALDELHTYAQALIGGDA